jgi:outer membrane protein assembly factor BamB
MRISDVMFVGIKGTVVALNRGTGAILWQTKLKGSEFVNLVEDGANIYATTHGEAFCLDPATGQIRWHNELKGLGTGLASLLIPNMPQMQQTVLLAEEHRRDEQAAAAAAAASAA